MGACECPEQSPGYSIRMMLLLLVGRQAWTRGLKSVAVGACPIVAAPPDYDLWCPPSTKFP